MNKRIDSQRLRLLFEETLQAPESGFPFPQPGLTMSPEETARLNKKLDQAFAVRNPNAFVLDRAHQ